MIYTLIFTPLLCYCLTGPPLAPAITEHKLLNATSLLIAWSPPFTWLPIQSYKITVEGDFVHERKEILTMEPTGSNQTQVFVYTKKDIVCGEVITFTVTAINSVAESDNSAPVVSGFPIGKIGSNKRKLIIKWWSPYFQIQKYFYLPSRFR